MNGKILVVGSSGQIGSELVEALREKYGDDQVVATDIREPQYRDENKLFEVLNILDRDALDSVIKRHNIKSIYMLAAVLSAKGEADPIGTWNINMDSLLNTLEAGVEHKLERIFWPSSIAVFGPTTEKLNTAQHPYMDPNTVYGFSKLAGERWCDYYFQRYGLDVRSIRYPGLISYKAAPGGGTTDYAIEIFIEAIKHGKYASFLEEDAALPMMYMEDAIRATIELMEAPSENIKERGAYNIESMSFSPAEIGAMIKKEMPEFELTYAPDFRQKIANGWPRSIDGQAASRDWNWKPKYDLESMVKDMLLQIGKKYGGKAVID